MVLVTGATGILGRVLVLELLKQHGFFTLPVVAINQSFDFAFCGFQPDKLNDLLK